MLFYFSSPMAQVAKAHKYARLYGSGVSLGLVFKARGTEEFETL